MGRWVVPRRLGLPFAGVAVGAVGAWAVAQRWPLEAWRVWLPDLLVGWAFLVSGTLIGRRPGDGRQGLLVAAVGASWFVADVVPQAALLHRAVLIHATVAMPRGRVSGRMGWIVVSAGYADAVLASVVASPVVPLVLAVGLLAVARISAGPRRTACSLVGALLATLALTLFASSGAVGAAVLLVYEVGLVAVAAVLAATVVRDPSRSDVTDLVVEMGPQDALADLAHRDPTVLEDPALATAVAAADRLRAANARLTADLEHRIVAVDESRRRLLAAQDAERAALEDRLQRGPSGRLDRVAAHLASQSSEVTEAQDRLSAARSQLAAARADLLRIARGLYPGAIADGSLESALHSIAASSPIPVELDLRVLRVEPETAAVVYFVCSEAVANAARHSRATQVTILVEQRLSGASRAEVVVEVSDDGIGGAAMEQGSGLPGLVDRVGIAGGVLTVDSGPSGTRIAARIPDGPDAVTEGR